MRPLLAASLLALSVLAAGCKNPCEELGNRLCGCQLSGTSRTTCETQVKNRIDSANPNGDQETFCDQKLGECHAPPGAIFCEWVETADGKVACGLAAEAPAP